MKEFILKYLIWQNSTRIQRMKDHSGNIQTTVNQQIIKKQAPIHCVYLVVWGYYTTD